jgi:hypothetical protein
VNATYTCTNPIPPKSAGCVADRKPGQLPRGDIGGAGWVWVHIWRQAILWLVHILGRYRLSGGEQQNRRSEQCDEP